MENIYHSHSLSDFNKNKNIISFENEYKNKDKGKLFKGSNRNAFNKENLGSIPIKVEKVLLREDKNITRIGFSTKCERFFIKKDIIYPGPGSYNLRDDNDYTNASSSFISNKGLGNGFASRSERFDNKELFITKYTPGPGEYEPESKVNIENDIKNSIKGKSLFYSSKANPLHIKNSNPGPGYYEPKFKHIEIKKSKYEHPVFKSTVSRFIKNNNSKNDIPGPGRYFNNNFYYIKNNNKSQSFFFKENQPKKVDLLKKYNIGKIERSKSTDRKYITSSSSFNNYYDNRAKDLRRNINEKRISFYLKKISIRDKEHFNESLLQVPNGYKNNIHDSISSMLSMSPMFYKVKKTSQYLLWKPRWKKNKFTFQVPGPAYYNPKIQYKVYSFNNNKVDFIWSPGAKNYQIEK